VYSEATRGPNNRGLEWLVCEKMWRGRKARARALAYFKAPEGRPEEEPTGTRCQVGVTIPLGTALIFSNLRSGTRLRAGNGFLPALFDKADRSSVFYRRFEKINPGKRRMPTRRFDIPESIIKSAVEPGNPRAVNTKVAVHCKPPSHSCIDGAW